LLDPSNPLAFVKALGGDEAASQFVAMVERSARDCESPTKAVAFAWVYLARNAILHSARIGEVLDCCAQIASGESQAEWWDAIRSTEAA
jgi:hypothetical protein